MSKKKEMIATLELFLTAIIWGFAFVAQKKATENFGDFAFNGIRFILGAVSLIPVILIFDKGKKKERDFENISPKKGQRTNLVEKYPTILIGAGGGAILFFASALQQIGITEGSASKAGFLTALYIILVPIFEIFMKKGDKPTVFVFVGVVFALAGTFLLAGDGKGLQFAKEDILLVIGAVFWALHIIYIDRHFRKISSLKGAMVQFIVCGLIGIVVSLIYEKELDWTIAWGEALFPILYTGILSSGVAYTLQIIGQKNVSSARAAVIFSSESIFAAVGGMLILHEWLSVYGFIGCSLIFAGIMISFQKNRKINS